MVLLEGGEVLDVGSTVITGFQSSLTALQGNVQSIMTAGIPVALGIVAAFVIFKFGKKFIKTVTN